MAEKVSAASERARGAGHVGSSCSGSSSGSETLSEEGEPGGGGGGAATAPGGAMASPERAIPGGRAEDDASLEERDEEVRGAGGQRLLLRPLLRGRARSPAARPARVRGGGDPRRERLRAHLGTAPARQPRLNRDCLFVELCRR